LMIPVREQTGMDTDSPSGRRLLQFHKANRSLSHIRGAFG
jgi:hypothetical protein